MWLCHNWFLNPRFIWGLLGFILEYSAHGVLPIPPQKASWETLDEEVGPLFVEEGKAWALSGKKGILFWEPFQGIFRKKWKLGDWQQVGRWDLQAWGGPWEGLSFWEKASSNFMLMDGRELYMLQLDASKGEILGKKGIIWDRMEPYPDWGGRAPDFAIKDLRKNLLQSHEAIPLGWVKLSGLVSMPSQWEPFSKGKNWLVGSCFPQLRGVFIMSCSQATQCELRHPCYLKNLSGPVNSLAISLKRRQLLVAAEGRIQIYHFSSCEKTKFIKSLQLPSRLKSLRHIFIDEQDRLWVSTWGKDDYENSSIYFWEDW